MHFTWKQSKTSKINTKVLKARNNHKGVRKKKEIMKK